MFRSFVFSSALLVVGLTPTVVFAEEASAENKAAARELATQGIQLAQEGKCDEAIPKLVRAEKLYHAPTILTWVGQCQIQVGRLVEGTETLNRVVREKVESGAPEAYLDAQKRAQALIDEAQPKIARLTIEVAPADIDGLKVSVNERPIAAALVGAPRPTDPGKQTVTVSAPGFESQTQEIELAEGGRESISFTLKAIPGGQKATPDADTTDGTSNGGKSNQWLGWTVVGVGGALMAAGGVTGIVAMGKANDLEEACPDPKACDDSNQKTYDSAKTNATLSTVFLGVGGAAVVTGVVLLVTGKSGAKANVGTHDAPRVRPVVGVGSLGLIGSF